MEAAAGSLTAQQKQYWLQHLVGPRPIALASTTNTGGQANLSPFSFFNLFSLDPPILVFSPSRRLRDGSTKHTLQNLQEVPEVVINIVSYDIVQQASLSSCEYYRGVDEFDKAGFSKAASVVVKPPRVLESPAAFECRVNDIIPLGQQGGAGNLVICEVLYVHARDGFDRSPDFAARLGGDWYARINHSNMFTIPKPVAGLGIGFDGLPAFIRECGIFNGNQLGLLANVAAIPAKDGHFTDSRLDVLNDYFKDNNKTERAMIYAAALLDQHKVQEAWQVLLTLV